MKTIKALIIATIFHLPLIGFAQNTGVVESDSIKGSGGFDAYVMLIKLRHDLWFRYQETGVWPNDTLANKALNGHVKYWEKLLMNGTMVMGGGMGGDFWDNVAMIIFEADSLEHAEKIVAEDPAVKAYVFKAQVRPFRVHNISNKYFIREGESKD
jgi:uncharacterized protein YciI